MLLNIKQKVYVFYKAMNIHDFSKLFLNNLVVINFY